MAKRGSKLSEAELNNVQEGEEDPYHLKEYQSDHIPADGGQAPLPKTAEPESYHDNRIYVSNIPFTFEEEDLKTLFSRFGIVKSAMIVCNERGSKGFGFVTMDSIDNCERARSNLHGAKILGRVIEVRKATPLARPPFPKRGHGSVSSSCTSSPHRTPASRTHHMRKRVPAPSGNPTIAINPQHAMASALGLGQSASARLPPPQVVPIANIINPQNSALNVLLSDNQLLLQNLLTPLHLQAQLRAPFQAAVPQAFYTSAPYYPAPLQPATLLPYSMPPLQQSQAGFAYRVASIPQQYVTVGPSTCYVDQKQQPPQYYQGSSSLNNTTILNNTILSTSMNAHMQGMQEHLVDFLNLDGTMNHSKLLELRGSRDCSLNASSTSSEMNETCRKRRSLVVINEGSPRKMSKLHQSN